MKKNSKIAIVAGGTGGHIFPAISLLEQLIIEKKEIIFFSDTRVRNIINKNKCLFRKKNVTFYSLRISKNFKDFFSFFKNFFKIFIFIKKNDPKIIVGFGGYTSIPFLLISKILFKPIILHEQNIIIGLTNKIFSEIDKKRWTSAINLASDVRNRAIYRLVKWLYLIEPNIQANFYEYINFINLIFC